MAQKTAVDWLIQQLPIRTINSFSKEIEQAKQMEKERIKTAFKNGIYEGVLTDINYKNCDEEAEFYYNSTYGSNNQI